MRWNILTHLIGFTSLYFVAQNLCERLNFFPLDLWISSSRFTSCLVNSRYACAISGLALFSALSELLALFSAERALFSASTLALAIEFERASLSASTHVSAIEFLFSICGQYTRGPCLRTRDRKWLWNYLNNQFLSLFGTAGAPLSLCLQSYCPMQY